MTAAQQSPVRQLHYHGVYRVQEGALHQRCLMTLVMAVILAPQLSADSRVRLQTWQMVQVPVEAAETLCGVDVAAE